MSESNSISEEQLHAFVDGQLDGSEQAHVLLALEASDELRAKVAGLRRLKDMVRLAYDDVPLPHARPIVVPRIGGYALAAAAGALITLAVGQLISWNWSSESLHDSRVMTTGPTDASLASFSAGDPEMVMFHISNADDQVAAELLDQVELVASQYRRWGRSLRIVVIANNEGLRLYQIGHKRNERRIEKLFARYDNITFAACGNTLDRLSRAGDPVQLLPQAIVVDSGVAEIARRQKQGWRYIRI